MPDDLVHFERDGATKTMSAEEAEFAGPALDAKGWKKVRAAKAAAVEKAATAATEKEH